MSPRLSLALVISSAMLLLSPCAAQAGFLARHAKPSPSPITITNVDEIQRALDDHRYVDATRLLDEATFSGAKDSMLVVLEGDLSLAQGQYAAALAQFQQAEATPGQKGRALQGEG